MAGLEETITQLQLATAVTDGMNIPGDNGIITTRFTALQLFTYIRSKLGSARTISAGGGTVLSSDVMLFLDPTAAGFTQALPAVATLPVGFIIEFKNVATNGNVVTIDANGTELIDAHETFALESDPVMEHVTLYNNGTKWLTI